VEPLILTTGLCSRRLRRSAMALFQGRLESIRIDSEE